MEWFYFWDCMCMYVYTRLDVILSTALTYLLVALSPISAECYSWLGLSALESDPDRKACCCLALREPIEMSSAVSFKFMPISYLFENNFRGRARGGSFLYLGAECLTCERANHRLTASTAPNARRERFHLFSNCALLSRRSCKWLNASGGGTGRGNRMPPVL